MMHLNHQNDLLDRVWAATRPEEPGPEVFDKIWATVSARASEPEPPTILSFVNWKQLGLSLAIAGQAAALLIAGFVALNRPAPSPTSLASRASLESHSMELAANNLRNDEGTTLFVSLGERRGQPVRIVTRPQVPQSETDAVAIESDILGYMESYRSVPVHDLRVAEGATLFVSIDGIGELARVETRPQVPESETDVVAAESDLLNFMESFK